MDSLETTACFRDDLFDFPSDISDDDDDNNNHHHNHRRNAAVVLSSHHRRRHRSSAFSLLSCPSRLRPSAFPEFVEEEELEWISNKDAFPMVESFVDIMPNHPSISTTSNNNINNNNNNNNSSSSHLSPVSVLENSSTSCSINSFNFSSRGTENDNSNNNNNSNSRSRNSSGGGGDAGAIAAMIGLTGIFKVPGRARSKQLRRRKREMSGERFYCWEKVKPHSCKVVAKQQQQQQQPSTSSSGIGRKCLHCGSEKTPQWRAGPLGPKTLCNACGVRYKSGRLVPEYRPASSPTFSSELHSNSHRKIVEMRKQKMSIFGDP